MGEHGGGAGDTEALAGTVWEMTAKSGIPELLTLHEVALLFRVCRYTVYRMVKAGQIRGIKVGHSWRFRRSEMEAYIQGGVS